MKAKSLLCLAALAVFSFGASALGGAVVPKVAARMTDSDLVAADVATFSIPSPIYNIPIEQTTNSSNAAVDGVSEAGALTAVPEPNTLLLLATGAAAAALWRRRSAG